MPATGPKAKHWCFTLNNYTQQDLDHLSTPISGVDYLVYGKKADNLQGVVCFQSRKRLQQVVAMVERAHYTLPKHLSQSIEYCKKDGDFIEWGIDPNTGMKVNNELTYPPKFSSQSMRWCFTIPHVTDAKIDYLSNLHHSNKALYITFAILEDRYIQGFLKTPNIHRIGSLREWIHPALLDCNAILTPCSSQELVYEALLEIQMNPFKEFGSNQRTQWFRLRIPYFKKQIELGASIEQLTKNFPEISPLLLKKHVDKFARSSPPIQTPAPSIPDTQTPSPVPNTAVATTNKIREWVAAGLAWLKGSKSTIYELH